jgi:hypothetical protein
MYCDQCGTPFTGGAQFCTSCGKPILGGGKATPPTASSSVPPGRLASDGRVLRNLSLLAGLWAANGVLRLMEIGGLFGFRRMFGWGWGWPFSNWGPGTPWIFGGLLSGGLMLAFFGMVHLLLAWGLFERQPWARILGIVVALLALIRIPFGTALGIYTLWVLLPERSGREYDSLAGVKPQTT